MDFLDVQTYIVIKLLLLLFVIVSIYLVYKKKNPLYFLFLTGIISATSYYVFVNNLQLPFFGLQGDEITLTAMYNTVSQVGPGLDFAHFNLAAFYPPAFFWLFGMIGKIFNLNGVLIYKLAGFTFFLIFPLGLYYFQKYLLKDKTEEINPGKIFIFLSPLLILTILDKDLLFSKPYEVIAAAATVFWCISLYIKISRDKFNLKQLLIHGIIAGVIFMTYYLWLIFAALALLLLGLIEKNRNIIKYFFVLFKTMIIALLVAIPFLGPLINSYLKNGLESWQTAFFTPSGLDLWLPMFKFDTINSLILLFGLIVLIYYRNRIFIKVLLYLFIGSFVWWSIGMISLLALKVPFQEFRGFYIWAPIILVIAAAYGLERLIIHYRISEKKDYYLSVCIIGLVFFASQSIFGFFIDNPGVRKYREEAKTIPKPIANLITYLKQDNYPYSKITLQTVPQVLAFVPTNQLIYFNQHNNNPAAIFSKRYEYVESLAASKTAEELYQKIKACPYGELNRFIFFANGENYYLYFHLNKIIQGIETKEIVISKNLFSSSHFKVVYSQDSYVVIEVVD
jgi:hypothetical protein